MTRARQELGLLGEALACQFLLKRGYEILAQRFRNRSGEIDIIAKQGTQIIFVEVKLKSGSGRGLPEEMVGERKQRQIAKAIREFVMELTYEPDCRIDVIAIDYNQGEPLIRHYENAFEIRS